MRKKGVCDVCSFRHEQSSRRDTPGEASSAGFPLVCLPEVDPLSTPELAISSHIRKALRKLLFASADTHMSSAKNNRHTNSGGPGGSHI